MRTKVYLFLLLSGMLLGACSKVPVTGRKQMRLLPDGLLHSMAFANYQAFKDTNSVVSPKDPRNNMLQEIGPKLAEAAVDILRESGQGKKASSYQWEYNMFNNPTVNAWAMPGGKIAVYTGILAYTKDVNGLATVIGHEIAHVIARHGNERMSQQLAIALGGMSLQVAMEKEPEKTRDIFMMVYGVGSTLGTLAYSRKHEYEADKIGMVLMAKAGYDPNHAVAFWERMTAAGAGQFIPEFLSTHPSDVNRVAAMKEYLPKAMEHYKAE